LPDPTGDRLLALLLIWSLLLCHGIFGSLHELSNLAIPEHLAAEEQGEHEPSRHLQAGAHDYAAALLALLLGTVYWFLRLAARSRNASPPPRHALPLPTTRIFHLPYAKGLPLLQVFRL
jgi:hypothetical protein